MRPGDSPARHLRYPDRSMSRVRAIGEVARERNPGRHKVRDERCPGSGGLPAEDPALAAWLPVRQGLTPHGFRDSKRTWMIEDWIPEILAETSLCHLVPGMRGRYPHVSERIRRHLWRATRPLGGKPTRSVGRPASEHRKRRGSPFSLLVTLS